MAGKRSRTSGKKGGRDEIAGKLGDRQPEALSKSLNIKKKLGKRTKKVKVSTAEEEQIEAIGKSDIVEPLPLLNPRMKFRKEYQSKVSAKGVKVTEYNNIARAAYNRLNKKDVRKRKKECLKEKEAYEKEMACLGTSIMQKPRATAKNHKYTIRCSPNQIVTFVSRIDETKKQQIRDMGFGGLLDIRCHSIPNNIATWLVDNFNPTLSSLHLHGDGVLPLTARDISLVLGIPNTGPVPVEDVDTNEVGGSGPRRRTYKWKELPNELVSMSPGEEFKRLFVAFACGCLLAPSTRAEHKIKLWGCTQLVGKLATLNWAEYVRNVLCNKVLEVQKKSKKQHQYVGGCIFVLLIHYLDRVTILKHKVPRTIPIAKAWTDALISERDAIEIDNLGDYGKGKLVGPHDLVEAEFGSWMTEFPPDLVGMMLDNGHADVSAELSELYKIAVTSQWRILKIAEMISSHRRAKASCNQVESLHTSEKHMGEIELVHRNTEREEGSENESTEEGDNDEKNEGDEGAKDHDGDKNTSDGNGAGRAIDDTINVSGQHEEQDHRNGKDTVRNNDGQEDEGIGQSLGIVTQMVIGTSVEGRGFAEVNKDFLEVGKAIEVSTFLKISGHAVNKCGDCTTTIIERNIDDQQQQELHNPNIMKCYGEGQCLEEQASHPSRNDYPAFDTHIPRRLLSYGRNQQVSGKEVEQKPTRTTKKSTMLSNLAEVVTIDDNNKEAVPPSEPPQQMLTNIPDIDLTNERELKKKLKVAEVENEEQDEVAIATNPLAMAAPTSSDEEETIKEDPHPIGKVVKVSGKGAGRRKHYKSFGYDGNRYNLEDPVLLVPDEPNQKPDMAIIKDITQTKGGRMMVTGQRFYRPEEAEKKDGGFWQSNNTRELFYSFHKDVFPAESVTHRFVVHFIPPKMQIPPRTEHPGFIVQKMYYTKRKLLFKLKDAGANKEEEIDLLVQKTKSQLENLPNIQPKDVVAHSRHLCN